MRGGSIGPKRQGDIRLKRLGRTGILLNVRTGDFFELDATALAIWQQLDGKTDVATVARRLARRFDARIGDVEPDVRRFVSMLRRRGLIDVAG